MEQSPDGQQPPAKYLCVGCEGDYRNHGTNAVYLCNFSDTSGNKPKNMSEFTSDKLEGFFCSPLNKFSLEHFESKCPFSFTKVKTSFP